MTESVKTKDCLIRNISRGSNRTFHRLNVDLPQPLIGLHTHIYLNPDLRSNDMVPCICEYTNKNPWIRRGNTKKKANGKWLSACTDFKITLICLALMSRKQKKKGKKQKYIQKKNIYIRRQRFIYRRLSAGLDYQQWKTAFCLRLYSWRQSIRKIGVQTAEPVKWKTSVQILWI